MKLSLFILMCHPFSKQHRSVYLDILSVYVFKHNFSLFKLNISSYCVQLWVFGVRIINIYSEPRWQEKLTELSKEYKRIGDKYVSK